MWGLSDWQRIGLGILCFPLGFALMVLPYLVRLGRAGGMMIVVGGICIAVGAALLLNIKNSFKV